MDKIAVDVFRNGSKTYFYSSLFFPEPKRTEVTTLYAFVRILDDCVDAIPSQQKEYFQLKAQYQLSEKKYVDHKIIQSFRNLMQRYPIDPQWVNAFFRSMEMDIEKRTYKTLKETEEYMYGSAEVVGLMMSAILDLPTESYKTAQKLGKAMQYINFIRDIDEDNKLGRQYFPLSERKQFQLYSLTEENARLRGDNFIGFIRQQINIYRQWQLEAEEGFKYIPWRYKIPIKTASDMYKWTANQIYDDPCVVFREKVKPSKSHILLQALRNTLPL